MIDLTMENLNETLKNRVEMFRQENLELNLTDEQIISLFKIIKRERVTKKFIEKEKHLQSIDY
jgi:hypothetical protein